MRSDKNRIALDLFERLRLLRGGEVSHALAGNRHEPSVGRHNNVHCSRRRLHFRVQMIGVNDDGFHWNGKLALRSFLGEGDLCFNRFNAGEFRFAAHSRHHLRGQSLAFVVRGSGFGVLFFFVAQRGRNRYVNFFDRAERRQSLVEFLRVANDQHGKLVAVNVFCGYTVHILRGDFLNFHRIFIKPVGRISVELIGHAFGENFVGRVETEDEGVEDGVFGVPDLLVRDRLLGQIIDIFVERLHRLYRALAFCAGHELHHAWMAEVRSDAAAYVVGEAALGADVIEQARREAAAESFVENGDRVVVRIVARGAERHQVNAALIDVILRNEIITRFRRLKLDFRFRQFRCFGPRLERGAQLALHGCGVEVAADAEDDAIGVDVILMPVDQILASNGRDGCILGLANVGIIRSICQLRSFAGGDLANLVVAARDGIVGLLLRNVELVGAKFGILQQIGEDLENVVKIALEA